MEKMKKNTIPGLLACMILSMTGCITTDSDTVSGWSFQSDNYSNHGEHSYATVNKSNGHPVRSGEKSMRFEVRPGECGISKYWSDCAWHRQRSEKIQHGYEFGEKWYHWSIYIHPDMKDSYGSPVLGQFHYTKPQTSVAIFFQLWVTKDPETQKYIHAYVARPFLPHYISSRKDVVLSNLDNMTGKWTDVLVHVNWSRKKDGFFRVYLNGNTVAKFDYTGITSPEDVYFKFGIYRGQVDDIQIVYYDDVRKGSSCKEVTLYFDCDTITTR